MEWIPYNRLRNIQYLASGGFSTIYKAIWLDGPIQKWSKVNKQWKRYSTSLEIYGNVKMKTLNHLLIKMKKKDTVLC